MRRPQKLHLRTNQDYLGIILETSWGAGNQPNTHLGQVLDHTAPPWTHPGSDSSNRDGHPGPSRTHFVRAAPPKLYIALHLTKQREIKKEAKLHGSTKFGQHIVERIDHLEILPEHHMTVPETFPKRSQLFLNPFPTVSNLSLDVPKSVPNGS